MLVDLNQFDYKGVACSALIAYMSSPLGSDIPADIASLIPLQKGLDPQQDRLE